MVPGALVTMFTSLNEVSIRSFYRLGFEHGEVKRKFVCLVFHRCFTLDISTEYLATPTLYAHAQDFLIKY